MSELTAPQTEALREAGQEHLLERLARLDTDSSKRLSGQIEALDLALVARLRELLRSPEEALPTGPGMQETQRAPTLEPPELFPLRRDGELRARAAAARERGEEALAAGRVGFVLVAGGQASRLGLEAPKGTFPVAPVSRRSLFELHARRLLAVRRRYGVATPWYVMTSPANDAATRAFFAEHDWFELPRADVRFFQQDMLPALDEQGRILLAGPDRLFLAPDGHGGSLAGLARSGALAEARSRGLEQLSYFQVDNPLVRPADPLFLGLHDEARAGMSSKVVEKRHAGEKVGVLGRIDGRMGCIEYSDLPPELREAREADGALRFRAGNIAVHLLRLEFVERLTAGGRLELPWHLARKTMKVCDEAGRQVECQGTKFETFVFDALARSEASVTLEVERSEEFSPVKNAEGEDSPASARADQCRLFARWARSAGHPLPAPDAAGLHAVEVDPLVAESEEEFRTRAAERRPEVREGGHLYR